MTTPETDLLAALYLLYSSDCIHWLRPGEIAFSRSSSTEWKRYLPLPLSFTLLGRMPVLADPLLFRPGFIRIKSVKDIQQKTEARALRKAALHLNALWLSRMLCRMQAILLLIYAPLIVWTNHLAVLWPRLLLVLSVNHTLLLFSSWAALRRYKQTSIFNTIAPMLLNPLGATRMMDILAQAAFEHEFGRTSSRIQHPEQTLVH